MRPQDFFVNLRANKISEHKQKWKNQKSKMKKIKLLLVFNKSCIHWILLGFDGTLINWLENAW